MLLSSRRLLRWLLLVRRLFRGLTLCVRWCLYWRGLCLLLTLWNGRRVMALYLGTFMRLLAFVRVLWRSEVLNRGILVTWILLGLCWIRSLLRVRRLVSRAWLCCAWSMEVSYWIVLVSNRRGCGCRLSLTGFGLFCDSLFAGAGVSGVRLLAVGLLLCVGGIVFADWLFY